MEECVSFFELILLGIGNSVVFLLIAYLLKLLPNQYKNQFKEDD